MDEVTQLSFGRALQAKRISSTKFVRLECAGHIHGPEEANWG